MHRKNERILGYLQPIAPDYTESYNSRGSAYRNLQEYDKAIADYNRALELNPDCAEIYENGELAKNVKKTMIPLIF